MKPIYLLSLIPVIAILGGPFWANSIEPYILGMPLFFFWNFSWLIFTALVVFIIYMLDPKNKEREEK
ncbi:DUF3311 domain-containing protein [Peribacillus frigoritolerans]|uniref:DUF3311 domain-containing protein n=1 Tax=Peribacillus frigoritolerans TaxID=450367 RepID=A0AAJ1VFM4_9BACI|nr:DUF3311 domain-containing protein [Peribacillus frigoritolerans]MDM5286633.1 DUF3311 domain-containing protein [Peribacillus frigoritolerans]